MARAIIIDDNPSGAMLLEFMLEELGIHSQSMHKPEDVQEHLKAHQYDLMLLDWMMPVMEGIELLGALRQNEALNGMKIVICTGRTSEEDQHAALKAGSDAFLSKPITVDMLRGTLSDIGLLH